MAWTGLGAVTVAVPGTPLRITNNQADPTARISCQSVLLQALSNVAHTNVGRVYILDRDGVRVGTLAPPATNTIPSASATIPSVPGALNAADYWVDADNAGDGVDVSYSRP